MFEPWCEPWIFFTVYSVFVGGVCGTLLGVAGGMGGDLARKGQRRAWIGIALKAVIIFGILSFVVGFVAVVFSQPFGISATLLGFGAAFSWLAWRTDRTLRKACQDALMSSDLFTADADRQN